VTPSVGRIVHYTLTEYDAQAINQRREDASAFQRSVTVRPEPGERGRTGHVLHVGNTAREGDAYPAMIVRTFGETTVNLQVHLDGDDTYWATSRMEGDGSPGTWIWPPRV
jgi:hypothetical protein